MNLQEVVSVRTDVAFNEDAETLESALASVLHPDVTWRLVTAIGPGGGWPEVDLIGRRADVLDSLIAMAGGDDMQAGEMMAGAKEVGP